MQTGLLQRQWQRLKAVRGRRVYILPSRAGYAFAGLILLMLLGAINYNNSLGYLLAFLLASIGHVTMHHSYRNLRYLQCRISQPQPVFAGQNLLLPLSLHNPRNHALYQVDIAAGPLPGKRHWNPIKQFSKYQPSATAAYLPGQQQQMFQLSFKTSQRGWMTLNNVRLSSVFPLGLLVCWFFSETVYKALIYPAAHGLLPLPEIGNTGSQQSTSQRSGKDDFAGFQKYRDGDARHQIAWKALARDDVLRSKQFSQPKGDQITLDWADLDHLNHTEKKLSQLCQWVLAADATGNPYSLMLPGQQIPHSQGETHRHKCLKALALYGQ